MGPRLSDIQNLEIKKTRENFFKTGKVFEYNMDLSDSLTEAEKNGKVASLPMILDAYVFADKTDSEISEYLNKKKGWFSTSTWEVSGWYDGEPKAVVMHNVSLLSPDWVKRIKIEKPIGFLPEKIMLKYDRNYQHRYFGFAMPVTNDEFSELVTNHVLPFGKEEKIVTLEDLADGAVKNPLSDDYGIIVDLSTLNARNSLNIARTGGDLLYERLKKYLNSLSNADEESNFIQKMSEEERIMLSLSQITKQIGPCAYMLAVEAPGLAKIKYINDYHKFISYKE